MDVISIIETLLFQKLCSSDIVGMVGFHPTDTDTVQVYNRQGKSGAKYPLVVFAQTSGNREHETQRYEFKTLYLVSAYAEDGPTARKLFGYISDALSDAELGTINNFHIYKCSERQYFGQVENIEGNQYYRQAAYYEINGILTI